MSLVRWFSGLVLAGLLYGCGGESSEDPADGADEGSDPAELAAREACSTVPQGSRKPATVEAFHELIVGSWLLCSPESAFGTTDEQGLVIYDNYRWAKLFDPGEGELEPGVGWGLEGTWESLDTSDANGPGVYQLNLNIDGSGGTVITVPVLAETPEYMRLGNAGYYGDYARL